LIIDPQTTDVFNFYKVMIGSIVPRPIAFVSTVSSDGVLNLAPFSFFTAASANPPVIVFCPMRRESGDLRKDTLRNITINKEFVVNVVSEEFARKMNMTSGEYPPEVNEFDLAGLTPVPSDLIKPPRVGEAHVQMECRLFLWIEIGDAPLSGNVVLGEVLRIHVDDAYFDNYKIDPDKLRPIGRMGGNAYSRTTDRFDMIRPK